MPKPGEFGRGSGEGLPAAAPLTRRDASAASVLECGWRREPPVSLWAWKAQESDENDALRLYHSI